MKDDPKRDNRGVVNRDGITQGSGHGDPLAKTRDAEGTPLAEDRDRPSITDKQGMDDQRRIDVDKPQD